jgi:DNA-binding transcriptional regulator YiaG
MSTKSILSERFGQRVQIRDVDRVPSGSSARLMLKATAELDAPAAALVLARRHLPLGAAHRVLTRLFDEGQVIVELPCVENIQIIERDLAATGIRSCLYEPPRVNVRAVREKLDLSQDEFALEFGLDVGMLRNWEQGRSEPDRASRTILWTIALHPDAVRRSLEERENPALEWAVSA